MGLAAKTRKRRGSRWSAFHRSLGWVAASSVLASSAPALAYRPFDGTDAGVAERHKVELELAPVGFYRQGDEHDLLLPNAVINFGLFRDVELVLQGVNTVRTDTGVPPPRMRLVDTGFFVKTVLKEGCIQGTPGLSFATEAGPLLPTLHDEPGVGGQAGAILSHCSKHMTLHYNAVATLTRAKHLDLFGGVIFEGSLDLTVRPVAELFVERELATRTMTYSILVGGIWRQSEELSIDFGLRVARIGEEGAGEVRGGLTWSFF